MTVRAVGVDGARTNGASPRLRLVKAEEPQTPEQRLACLFRQEREASELLDLIRTDIAVERRRYADKHGLITPPRVETLRREFGK